MISAYQSSLSALQAFSTRLQSNANNVANISTEGFKKTRVVFADQQPHGVKTHVEKVETPGAKIYEQTTDGYELIELSNVDLADELPGMNLSNTFYKANLKTIQATNEMFGSLLDLKA
ncbi:MAG: flagellar biosynthesis protein FlgC [Desulfobulbaceae bacterium]|nr:MAG: flagellar biosynthesis protein FlgC [Desulfobulbaceae bacterium]